MLMLTLIMSAALGLAPAQTPAAGPPALAYGSPVTNEAAKKAAAAAVAEARKNNLTMAIAVVDTAGNLVYFEKMDGTQNASVEIAVDKARSSAMFKRPTKFFQDGLAAGGVGLRFLGLRGAVPVDGGIPLILDGKVVGAIGASGGTSDQDTVRFGRRRNDEVNTRGSDDSTDSGVGDKSGTVS